MPIYPPDDRRWVKIARFVNILDDADNKLSPTKLSLWGSTVASFGTVLGGIFLWLSGHLAELSHIGDVGAMVGTWWGGSAGFHHMDKRERNLQAARMKGDPE